MSDASDSEALPSEVRHRLVIATELETSGDLGRYGRRVVIIGSSWSGLVSWRGRHRGVGAGRWVRGRVRRPGRRGAPGGVVSVLGRAVRAGAAGAGVRFVSRAVAFPGVVVVFIEQRPCWL